jgi:hypothetical protein
MPRRRLRIPLRRWDRFRLRHRLLRTCSLY